MQLKSHNEIVRYLRGGVSLVNLVVESERILTHCLPSMLAAYGCAPVTTKPRDIKVSAKMKTGTKRACILESSAVCPLAPHEATLAVLPDEFRSPIQSFCTKHKEAPLQAIRETRTLLARLPRGAPRIVYVLQDFAYGDKAKKVDDLLRRVLVEHSVSEAPFTVILVSDAPIEDTVLRAYMPVVRVERPSIEELAFAIERTLKACESVNKCTFLNDSQDTALDKDLCTSLATSLAGLDLPMAMSLLTTHLADVSEGKREKEYTLSPRKLATQKADILNKEGYLTLLHEYPSEDRIGGLDRLKEWIHKRVSGYLPEAREKKLATPKGIMLVGPPGTAKSMSICMIADILGVPLIRLDVGALFNSLIGSSERNLRRALDIADASSPCVLALDELDKTMGGSGERDGNTSGRVRGTLLTWLAEHKTDVFVAATVNDVKRLPPEMTRSGRWDAIFFCDLPTRAEREAIWRIHLGLVDQLEHLEDAIADLAIDSNGYTGAEIEVVVADAMYDAFEPGKPLKLTPDGLRQALKGTVPLSRSRQDDLKSLREWAAYNARPASVQEAETENSARNILGSPLADSLF